MNIINTEINMEMLNQQLKIIKENYKSNRD
jgi:hypothetical protein